MIKLQDVKSSAAAAGACGKLSGVHDWKGLCRLFFSPQGVEFCEYRNFPSLELFRSIKSRVARYGFQVDAGEIVRENDGCIALVGDTQAKLTFSDPTWVHKVVLMHGAKAEITATGYAVVRLINIGNCEVKINKQEHAVILN